MASDSPTNMVISVVGGTGALGGGLARRWAKAGLTVVIGSRNADKAAAAAAELRTAYPHSRVQGMGNLEAARAGDVVVLTVPFAQQRATLEGIQPALAGKILVYPMLHDLGLVPLSQLHKHLPTVAARLASGSWCKAAEDELLRTAGKP